MKYFSFFFYKLNLKICDLLNGVFKNLLQPDDFIFK